MRSLRRSAYGVSQVITPIYRAEAALLINWTQSPGTIAYNDILTSERLTLTYRELISKRPVLDDVVGNLDIDLDRRTPFAKPVVLLMIRSYARRSNERNACG